MAATAVLNRLLMSFVPEGLLFTKETPYEILKVKVDNLAKDVFSPKRKNASCLDDFKARFTLLTAQYETIQTESPLSDTQKICIETVLNTIEAQLPEKSAEEELIVSDDEVDSGSEDAEEVQETSPPKRPRVVEDVATVPTGITRHGNNCCMIAPMQLIRGIKGFIANINQQLFPSWKGFNGDDRALRAPFVKHFDKEFTKDRQQDAQEVLMKLITTMPNYPHTLQIQESTTFNTKALAGFSDDIVEENSLTTRNDPRSIIPLTIRNQKTNNFETIYRNFFIAPSNEFPSKRVTEGVSSKTIKASSITRTIQGNLPEHLLFSFDRFRFDNSQNRTVKNNTTIKNIPLDLKIDPGYLNGADPSDYELTGFIVHTGPSANSGHYYTLVKKEETWYLCNDDVVSRLEEADVKKELESSYILLYSKK